MKVRARRKDCEHRMEDDQFVSGQLVEVDGRYYIYKSAKMGLYGVIVINEYTEVDGDTIVYVHDSMRSDKG